MRHGRQARVFFPIFITYSCCLSGATWIDATGAWNVAGNWSPAVVPNGAVDVVFQQNAAGTSTVTIPGTFAIANMSFTSTTQAYILSGGSLLATPTAGNGITVAAASPSHTLDTNLSFLTTTPYTINQGSVNPLTISGAISGSVAISKTGTGTVILSGSSQNTNSGLVTLSAGQITLNKTAGVQALGDGVIITGAGATLFWGQSEQLSNSAPLTISNATAVVNLNGNTETIGTLTVTTAPAVSYDLNGTLNLSSTATALTVGGIAVTINGQINLTSGTGGNVSKTGAGALILQNIGVQNGTHDFSVTTGTVDITGQITGNGAISKSGTSTLTFSGTADNNYTGPTTITAGTLSLNHTAGTALPGDCFISGGTLLLTLGNQISNSSNLTITTGTFNMNSQSETINSLTMNGGTITNNNTGLSLASTGTALTLRNVIVPGQINLTGASGGNVVFDGSGGAVGTLNSVDLGSAIRTFNVGNIPAAVDLTVTGVVSGTGGITKIGSGTLQYTTTGSNNYSGLTTVTEGTLLLNKTAPFLAIQGNVLINGGTLQLALANQILDTSSVQITSGTFNLNNLAETISSLSYLGGTLTQGTGVLSLSSTGTALTMRNTVVNGTINLIGAGGSNVVFDDSNGGMAYINNIILDGANRTFTIAGGSDPNVKMLILNSSGAGGALVKDGPGILELTGVNTYTFATSQVLNGTLVVNGSLTAPTFTVTSSGVVKGTGTITAASTLNGTLQPGNSIGTINFVGNQTFGSTFVLENEITQTTTDLVNITGSLTINPGASVSVIPLVSTLSTPVTYTIIQTTTGVSGTFSSSSFPSLFYSSSLIYNPLTVQLVIDSVGFSQLVTKGNAGTVARYLDGLNIVPGSDLATIVDALRSLTSVEQLKKALFQLQPSPLKGLALSQENNAFQIESYILDRTKKKCCTPLCQSNVWVLFAGDQYFQSYIGEEKSFRTTSGHALIGIDGYLNECTLLGLAGGYTYSDVDWHDVHDKAQIQSGTLALYGNVRTGCVYFDGVLLWAYNHYYEKRGIKFSFIDRKARANTQGGQVVTNFTTGATFWSHDMNVGPFVSGQFMYLGIGSFHEKGANSIDLKVSNSHYSLFRGAVGFDFNRCFEFCQFKLATDLELKYIREQRWAGRNFTCRFVDNPHFRVKGMNPSRSVFSPDFNLSFLSCDENLSVMFGYHAEIGRRYFEQNIYIEGRFEF